jgi:hypothetical protein
MLYLCLVLAARLDRRFVEQNLLVAKPIACL